jgi:hypothetical protein
MSDTGAPSQSVFCTCNTCSERIEFEAGNAGSTIQCPHCGVDTVLFVPARAAPKWLSSVAQPKTVRCGACAGLVSARAVSCPHCGEPQGHGVGLDATFYTVLKVLVSLAMIGAVLWFVAAAFRFLTSTG